MDRRSFLSGAIGVAALCADPAGAEAEAPALRGSIDANARGIQPNSPYDQSRELTRLLNEAAAENRPVTLPPGRYIVENLVLPVAARIRGVGGASTLVCTGVEQGLSGERAEIVDLDGLVIEGGDRPLADYVPALVHIAECANVSITNCLITGSSKIGLALDRCGGRIERTTVTHAREAGIRALESTGLAISGNTVTDCGNGGILVWRWSEGEDGTIVTGNRVERIGASDGGTGENGNGINVFRAHGVMVANNRIADCAFSAVRANAASNVQIIGNNCRDCGEVGIYRRVRLLRRADRQQHRRRAPRPGSASPTSTRAAGSPWSPATSSATSSATGPYPAEAPGFGVGIAVEADAAVTGNVIDGAPLYGLALGWGPYLRDVAATGNVIRGAPVGIAVSVVEGSGAAVISDNLIAGADLGAILGMRWTDKASGDLARTGAEAFPHLMIERNRVG